MLGFKRKSAGHLQALDRVRAWTRERFKLPAEATILVAEVDCTVPGCPPIDTVVAFWTDDDKRHEFKIFKPVEDVMPDDVPYAWLKDSLAVRHGADCECC
jgi:hypothetical protein